MMGRVLILFPLSVGLYVFSSLSFPLIMLNRLTVGIALPVLFVWYALLLMGDAWKIEENTPSRVKGTWMKMRADEGTILAIHWLYLYVTIFSGAIFALFILYLLNAGILAVSGNWAVCFWFVVMYFLSFKYFASFQSGVFGLDCDTLGLASTYCAVAYANLSAKNVERSPSIALKYLRVSLLMVARMLEYRKFDSKLPKQLLARINADQLGGKPYARYPDVCIALAELPNYKELANLRGTLLGRESWITEFIPSTQNRSWERIQGIVTLGIGLATVVVTLLSETYRNQLTGTIVPAIPELIAIFTLSVLIIYLLRLTLQAVLISPEPDL